MPLAYATKSKALLAKVITIVQGLSGMGTVYKGVPESLSTRTSAYCCLAGQGPAQLTMGDKKRSIDILVTFGYRVAGVEGTAEDAVCDLVDLFIDAIETDETLGGLVYQARLDFGMASSPEYQAVAGQEYRRYPVIVRCQQIK